MKPSSPLPRRARRARCWTVVAVLAIAAALAACALTRPTLAKRTFLLEPSPPPMASVQKLASLRVGLVNVAAPYRGKAFVYRQDELKFEADYYSEFFVAPAAMLSEATARRARVGERVPPHDSARRGGRRRLRAGRVRLRTLWRRARCGQARGRGRDHVLPFAGECAGADRDLVARIPAAGTGGGGDFRSARPGIECALSAILADLARDLAAAELPK